MGYVGNQQTEGFSQVPAKQDLTGATGTSLTLTHAVASAEGIDLFINNVRQEPTEAYSVVGTAVTLTGSVVATDDIYVVYNSLALQTTVPPDASVSTAKIIDGSVTKAKIGTTELDLATIKNSTGTNTAMTIDSNGRVSMPARPIFYAVSEDNFAHANGRYSTLATWTADINRNNIFSTTTGKFTAPVAGIYQVSTGLTFTGLADSHGDGWGIKIFKNGSDFTNVELAYVAGIQNGIEGHSNATIYMDLAVNDYVEVGGDGTTQSLNIQHLYFGAHLVG